LGCPECRTASTPTTAEDENMNLRTRPARAVAAVGAVVAAGTTTFMAATAGTASADEPGHCVQNVNIREEPDTSSRIVALCEAGTEVKLGAERDGWVRIDELGGWASKDYVKADEQSPDSHGSDSHGSDSHGSDSHGSDSHGSDSRHRSSSADHSSGDRSDEDAGDNGGDRSQSGGDDRSGDASGDEVHGLLG
jgi:Bacterial SH3 domain